MPHPPNPILDILVNNGLVSYNEDTKEWVAEDPVLMKNAGDLVRAEEWVRVLYTLAVQGNSNTKVMRTIIARFNNFEELQDPALLEDIRNVIAKVAEIDDTLTISMDSIDSLKDIGIEVT